MKGVSLLSAYETIQTILGFGMFTIALISLIVNMLKNDKKKALYFLMLVDDTSIFFIFQNI